MKKNMGLADQVIRTVLAAVAIVLYWANLVSGTLAVVVLAIGVVLLLTSLLAWCPLYTLFGWSTRRK